MLAVTTSSIPGHEVERVLEAQFSHVVFGANLFSDMAGGLRDIFGGRSKSYQMQLDRLTKTAIDELKAKCTRLGANAIVGLSTDFEELSAGGKGGMFMLVASGTPVVILGLQENPDAASHDSLMSVQEFERGLARNQINSTDSAWRILKLIEETEAWDEMPHAVVCASKDSQPAGAAELIGKCPSSRPLLDALDRPEILAKHLVTACINRVADLDGIDIPDILQRILRADEVRVVNRLHRLLMKARKSKSVFTLSDLEALEQIRSEWPDRYPEVCIWRDKRGLTGKATRQWALSEDGPWYLDDDGMAGTPADKRGLMPHLTVVMKSIEVLIEGLQPLKPS